MAMPERLIALDESVALTKSYIRKITESPGEAVAVYSECLADLILNHREGTMSIEEATLIVTAGIRAFVRAMMSLEKKHEL